MFNRATDRLDIRVTDIRAHASGDLRDARARAKVRTGAFQIALAGMYFPLKRLDAEAALANGNIDPLHIRIDMNSSWIELNGILSNLMDTPRVDLTLQTDVFLAELSRWMDLGSRLSGKVACHATARGHWPEPEIKLRLSMGEGSVYGQRIEKARVRARMTDRRIRIHPVEVFLAGGKLSLSGEADLASVFDKVANAPVRYSAVMDVNGIDLSRVFWLEGLLGGPC